MSEGNPTRRSIRPWVAWLAAAAAGLAALVVVFQVALPARRQRDDLAAELTRLQAELSTAKAGVAEQDTQLRALLQDKDSLSEEKTAVQEQLASALQEKQAALAELDKAKKELNDALGTQIAAGDVLIKERNGELIIDVSDKLLFDSGQTAVNEVGKTFLGDVARSMKRLSVRQVFQVGGHTDYQRVVTPELAERYPTNWELSAARATQVVRYLQEEGKVPGRQLIAAGFSQYRPVATNKTDAGRQQNRRIEIVLQRVPKATKP